MAISQSLARFLLPCCLRDERIGFIDLALQLSQFALQLHQQHAQKPGQLIIGILQDAGQ
jgi:hypothetical protein